MNYVAGFMFSEDRSAVALIKKNKPEWQKGLYNGIGGKIEKREAPLSAMIREFKEETGVDHNDWISLCMLEGDDWTVYFYYTFSDKVYKVRSMEEEKVGIVSPMALPDCIFNLRWLIPLALDDADYNIIM